MDVLLLHMHANHVHKRLHACSATCILRDRDCMHALPHARFARSRLHACSCMHASNHVAGAWHHVVTRVIFGVRAVHAQLKKNDPTQPISVHMKLITKSVQKTSNFEGRSKRTRLALRTWNHFWKASHIIQFIDMIPATSIKFGLVVYVKYWTWWTTKAALKKNMEARQQVWWLKEK